MARRRTATPAEAGNTSEMPESNEATESSRKVWTPHLYLTSNRLYGLAFSADGRNIDLRQRSQYTEDTTITLPEGGTVTYKAGEYTPWVPTVRQFHQKLSQPPFWVIQWLGAAEASRGDVVDLTSALDYFEQAKQDVMDTFEKASAELRALVIEARRLTGKEPSVPSEPGV